MIEAKGPAWVDTNFTPIQHGAETIVLFAEAISAVVYVCCRPLLGLGTSHALRLAARLATKTGCYFPKITVLEKCDAAAM